MLESANVVFDAKLTPNLEIMPKFRYLYRCDSIFVNGVGLNKK